MKLKVLLLKTKLTSPENVKGNIFEYFYSIRTCRSSLLFFEAASVGGASLLLSVLYRETNLAIFFFGFFGVIDAKLGSSKIGLVVTSRT